MDELEVVLGRLLRAALDHGGLRREDFAREMSALGFRWTGNTVTQVVTGRRTLSLLEVAGVCAVLKRSLGDLLGDRNFDLPAGFVTTKDLVAALTKGASEWRQNKEMYEKFFPAEHDEATVKVARALGVQPGVIMDSAEELWGHTPGLERDRRAPAREGESRRALQARRGHVTRGLIEELRAHLAGTESGR